jgi:hypothetical protein
MKKVRLATGAAAGAVVAQALGMMVAPAAHAASPIPGTKHVHYDRHGRTGLEPASICVPNQFARNVSTHGHLPELISYSGASFVCGQSAMLDHQQAGLTERVRFWKNNFHTLITTRRDGGIISGGKTFFFSLPDIHASNVCAALVDNGTSTVRFGPVCVPT